MKKRKFIIISLLLIFIVSNIFSQTKRKKISLDITSFDISDIPVENISAILDTATEVFNDYASYGSLLDDSGNVKYKYLTKFKKLFAINSKVVNDFLRRPGDLINYDDYINYAEIFAEYGGIKFDIKEAKIENITTDDNYYRINIRFKKLMYQGLDKDMTYKEYRKPFSYDLTLTLVLSKLTMEDPEIVKIIGHNLIVPIPKKESFAGGYITYGLATMNVVYSDYLVDNSSASENTISGKSQLSFAANYLRNFIGGSNIYWNIGLKMNTISFDLKSKTAISYHQKMNYDNIVDYDRVVTINANAINTTTINTISIPIGLSYRFDKGSLHTLFFGASITPSFYTKIKHQFKGTFFREKIIGSEKILLNSNIDNNQNLNCNGRGDGLKSGLSYNSKTSGYPISALFSIKYLYKYQYNQSIAILLNYGIDLSPALPNATEIFLGEDTTPTNSYNKNTSFTQSVYKDIKSNILSFGIGWYYNFKSRGFLF